MDLVSLPDNIIKVVDGVIYENLSLTKIMYERRDCREKLAVMVLNRPCTSHPPFSVFILST